MSDKALQPHQRIAEELRKRGWGICKDESARMFRIFEENAFPRIPRDRFGFAEPGYEDLEDLSSLTADTDLLDIHPSSKEDIDIP